MTDVITFVTSNDNKLREAEHILGLKLNRVKLELPEIQSMDLHAILELKIRAAYEQLKRPVMVEDAGLFVEAWGGFPGPFVKWMAETMGYAQFTQALPQDNRLVQWRVCYAYYDGEHLKICEGDVNGIIATEERGEGGWGFDPIFIPEGETQTYSELGDKKYDYSARQRALLALRDYLVREKVGSHD